MIAPIEKTDELLAELKALDDPIVDAVAEWEARVGENWAGDPSVRIMVTFKDSDIRRVWHSRDALDDAIRHVSERIMPDRHPYIFFQAESEWLDPDPPPKTRRRA